MGSAISCDDFRGALYVMTSSRPTRDIYIHEYHRRHGAHRKRRKLARRFAMMPLFIFMHMAALYNNNACFTITLRLISALYIAYFIRFSTAALQDAMI